MTAAVTRYKLLLDVPSRSPALDFEPTAAALADVITESDPQFAIGIFGGWGSGKTTLMYAIERCMNTGTTVTVQFTAWRYEREQHLIVPLLDTIREAIFEWGLEQDDRTSKKVARQTAATVGRAMQSILAGISMKVGFPGAVELSFDANKALDDHRRILGDDEQARVPRSFYHASFAALRSAFADFVEKTGAERIVVFVDDLDRCLPESALEVLESMKLFFDLNGFVFVVGLDNEIVQTVIDSKYRRLDGDAAGVTAADGSRPGISGADYVKKIFQLPYRVAPVSIAQLDGFLSKAYEEAGLTTDQRTELDDVAKPHLGFLVGNAAVNPREIKRFINGYIVLRKIHTDLVPDAVLAWQTITFREEWNLVRKAMLENGSVFTSAVSDRLNGTTTAIVDVDPELDAIPDDFLEYVSEGNPGRALLGVGADLDRYIASGEALVSTVDRRLLSALRALGDVRRQLADARRTEALSADALKDVRTKVSQARAGVSTVARGLVATRIEEDIAAFDARASELEAQGSPADWGRQEPVVSDLEQLVQSIRNRLQRLYRSGDVAGSTPSSQTTESDAAPSSLASA
jgi:hypothetical protein